MRSRMTTTAAGCLLLLLVLQATLAFPDYKDMRDLYETVVKAEEEAAEGAMPGQGGRAPSMRLRWGRRSDPSWTKPRTWQAQRKA
ncbi:uncharacterized protein LOC144144878 [Haemaphysalis longicornis]